MNNNVFTKLSYGVYIVSCTIDGKYTGCTVNSIMQVTAEPATIALSVHKDNYTNECICNAKKFAVSILAETSNPISIGTFGFRSGRTFNKFGNIPFQVIDELPIIQDSCAYLICEVINKIELETHTVFIANVLNGDVKTEEIPMTYSFYHKVIKGKSPKTAPTYIK